MFVYTLFKKDNKNCGLKLILNSHKYEFTLTTEHPYKICKNKLVFNSNQ